MNMSATGDAAVDTLSPSTAEVTKTNVALTAQSQWTSQSLAQLKQWPFVGSALAKTQGLYETVKIKSKYARRSLELMESSLRSLMSAQCFAMTMEKYQHEFKEIDDFGCHQLEKLQERFPFVLEPTDALYVKGKRIVDQRLIEPVSQVLHVGRESVTEHIYLVDEKFNCKITSAEVFVNRMLPDPSLTNPSQGTETNASENVHCDAAKEKLQSQYRRWRSRDSLKRLGSHIRHRFSSYATVRIDKCKQTAAGWSIPTSIYALYVYDRVNNAVQKQHAKLLKAVKLGKEQVSFGDQIHAGKACVRNILSKTTESTRNTAKRMWRHSSELRLLVKPYYDYCQSGISSIESLLQMALSYLKMKDTSILSNPIPKLTFALQYGMSRIWYIPRQYKSRVFSDSWMWKMLNREDISSSSLAKVD